MIIDDALIGRLERSAARLEASVAEVMVATGVPGASPPEPFCGGALIALGPGRYVNRAIGIGATPVPGDQVAVLEAFFLDRGLDPMVEVSSWASPSLIELLGQRNYRPAWFRNVFALTLSPGRSIVEADPAIDPAAATIRDVMIRLVDDELFGAWRDVLAAGNGLSTDAEKAVSDEFAAARYEMPQGANFLAFVDGQPAGCGSLEITDGVAWVGGAATVEAFRGRGIQAALLRHRLAIAANRDCDLGAASALPTGVSARNLSRHGFTLVHTQGEFVQRSPP